MGDWERRLLRVDMQNMDYPNASFWSPAANFKIPRIPRTIRYIIIHITGGIAMTEQNALNTFHGSRESTRDEEVREHLPSAHYIVNREGRVVQMVREANIANHVDVIGSRTNRESIGIEHVNQWNAEAHLHPTDVQYLASARLVSYLCQKYEIPIQHVTTRHAPGIRGHIEEAPHSSHVHCPNPAWDWERYIGMVAANPFQSFSDLIHDLSGPESLGDVIRRTSGTSGFSTRRGPLGR